MAEFNRPVAECLGKKPHILPNTPTLTASGTSIKPPSTPPPKRPDDADAPTTAPSVGGNKTKV